MLAPNAVSKVRDGREIAAPSKRAGPTRCALSRAEAQPVNCGDSGDYIGTGPDGLAMDRYKF